jgi:hypothetical protein
MALSMYYIKFDGITFVDLQFDSSTAACSWFLNHMADDDTWPVTIFLKCQVATIRQMFHRLCIHVIQKLRCVMNLLVLYFAKFRFVTCLYFLYILRGP